MAAGETSLKELCAILKRVDLMVTCDSGPMHIAAAMGTPTVALFGPTDPERTGPYGGGHKVLQGRMTCIPCFKRKCRENQCMREIEVEEVLAAAGEIVAAKASRFVHPVVDSGRREAWRWQEGRKI
jgi:ADP-heptose:LPS heptosyltransferase